MAISIVYRKRTEMRVEHEQVTHVSSPCRNLRPSYVWAKILMIMPLFPVPTFRHTLSDQASQPAGYLGFDAGHNRRMASKFYRKKHVAYRMGSFSSYKENHRLAGFASRREGAKVTRESLKGNLRVSLPWRVLRIFRYCERGSHCCMALLRECVVTFVNRSAPRHTSLHVRTSPSS